MKIDNFQDLEIWQTGKLLSVRIYELTNKSLFARDFSLKDQVRRCAVSIPSNIAEGFGRNNNNELIRFLRIAKGSCSELITQIIIASDIKYLPENEATNIISICTELDIKISKFLNYLLSKRKNKEFLNRE